MTLPHADPPETRRGVVGPFTGRQLATGLVVVLAAALVLVVATQPIVTPGAPSAPPDPAATQYLVGSPGEGLSVGDRAPELDVVGPDGAPTPLLDLNGNPIRLADVRGRPVWINFWASWCPPCLEELPHLQALHEKVAARGYRVVLINVDLPDRERTGRFLERKGVHLDSLVDRDGVLFQAIGLEALPSTFVLDREGRPVRFIEGGMSVQELETALLRANEKNVRRTFQ